MRQLVILSCESESTVSIQMVMQQETPLSVCIKYKCKKIAEIYYMYMK